MKTVRYDDKKLPVDETILSASEMIAKDFEAKGITGLYMVILVDVSQGSNSVRVASNMDPNEAQGFLKSLVEVVYEPKEGPISH